MRTKEGEEVVREKDKTSSGNRGKGRGTTRVRREKNNRTVMAIEPNLL